MSYYNMVKLLCFYDEIWPLMSDHAPDLKREMHKSNQVTINIIMHIVQRCHKHTCLSVFGIFTCLSEELWSFLVNDGIVDFRKSSILHQTKSNKIIYTFKV